MLGAGSSEKHVSDRAELGVPPQPANRGNAELLRALAMFTPKPATLFRRHFPKRYCNAKQEDKGSDYISLLFSGGRFDLVIHKGRLPQADMQGMSFAGENLGVRSSSGQMALHTNGPVAQVMLVLAAVLCPSVL